MVASLAKTMRYLPRVFLLLVFSVGMLILLDTCLVLLLFLVTILLAPHFRGFGFDLHVIWWREPWLTPWLFGAWLLATAAIGRFYLVKQRFRVLWLLVALLGVGWIYLGFSWYQDFPR